MSSLTMKFRKWAISKLAGNDLQIVVNANFDEEGRLLPTENLSLFIRVRFKIGSGIGKFDNMTFNNATTH